MSKLEKIKAFLNKNAFEYYIANIDEGKVVTINILIGEDSEENSFSSSCDCSNVTSIS